VGILEAIQVPGFLTLDEAGFAAYVEEARLHTDDHPILEHSSNYSFYDGERTFVANLEQILEHPPDAAALVRNGDARESKRLPGQVKASAVWRRLLLLAAQTGAQKDRALREKYVELAREMAAAAEALDPGEHNRRLADTLLAELIGGPGP
jgi:hypothetical protein